MKIIFKALFLQMFWFLTIIYGHNNPFSFFLASIFILFLNYYFYNFHYFKPKTFIFFAFLFSFFGFIHDFFFLKLSHIEISNSDYFWLNGLWVIFFCYYTDMLKKVARWPKLRLFLLGAMGGPLAYYNGLKMSLLISGPNNNLIFALIFFVSLYWGLFFMLSIQMIFHTPWWEKILDKSIVFSFDRFGFNRHKEKYEILNDEFVKDGYALITGGGSGIGLALAKKLFQSKINITITGRDKKKASNLLTDKKIVFAEFDLSDWDSFDLLAKEMPVFDFIVLNAGAMPHEITENKYGVESQAASQLFGHYYLLLCLMKNNKIGKGARIIWVTSGGMLLKKLDLKNLISVKKYDRIEVYANVKRAQVILCEELIKDSRFKDFSIYCMHPGWVNTQALRSGLPLFTSIFKYILRTPDQGADTIEWLIKTQTPLKNGALYFDRNIANAYPVKNKKEGLKDRAQLLTLLESYREQIKW